MHDAPATAAEEGATALDRTRALVVRQPLDGGGPDAVRALVEDRRGAEGTGWLLGGEDVATVSLFLEDGPALVWYVEHAGDTWADPAAELRQRSPLFDAGLADHVGDPADVVDAREQVVHAALPGRPGTPTDPDVVMVDVGVRPGPGTWLARALVAAFDALEDTWVGRRARRSSTDVLEDERMWTETLWLERVDGRYVVRWYMEADDMDHVTEAYETHGSRVARWSNALLDRLFEAPVETLGDPLAASDRTLLAHATAPDRP